MVRGFWGDIINSPYFSFGNEVDDPDDCLRFYKEVNFQNIYTNADITEFNIQKMIFQTEELDEFEYKFDRLRQVLKDKFDDPSGKYKPRSKKRRNKKKKIEESKVEEETEADADATTTATQPSEKDKTESITDKSEKPDEEETGIEEITDEQAEQMEKEQAEKDE